MNCAVCGEVCRCAEFAAPAETTEISGVQPASVIEPGTPVASGEPAPASSAVETPEAEDSAWREELSSRLNRYRSRRKMPPPRYPSLRLQFDAAPSSSGENHESLPTFEPVSNHALALDGMAQIPSAAGEIHQDVAETVPAPPPQTAKIIEFPRFAWGPPPPPLDQLAEPVGEAPRILEVPETVPPPPALGGITIEPASRPDVHRRPGIDVPVQSALLVRRIFASLMDWLIIAIACALFGEIFWKVAAVRLPMAQLLGLAAGVPCLFWAAYQYLMIVHAGTTPGLRIAGLELARFDGSPAKRSLRRWRVFACYLSAASLGMGYVWVFLDEDSLCWHDRITHTCLAPRARSATRMS